MKKITTSMILALLSCSMLGAVSKPSSLSDGKSETEKQIQQYNAEKEAAAAAADAKESAVEGPVVVTEDVIVYTSNANQPEGNLSAFGTYFVSVKAEGSLVQLKSFVGNEKRKYWGYGAELAANDINGLEAELRAAPGAEGARVIIVRGECALLNRGGAVRTYETDANRCRRCGACSKLGCPAISGRSPVIDAEKCVGCGMCASVCKCSAIRERA